MPSIANGWRGWHYTFERMSHYCSLVVCPFAVLMQGATCRGHWEFRQSWWCHAECFVPCIVNIYCRWQAIQVAHIFAQHIKCRLVQFKTVSQMFKCRQVFFLFARNVFLFPLPWKALVKSQPEKVWIPINAKHTLFPRAVNTLARSMILVLLPTPVEKYKLHGKSLCRFKATSVSGLLVMIGSCSCAAWFASKNTLVSHSPWSHSRSLTTLTVCEPSVTQFSMCFVNNQVLVKNS